MTSKSSLSFYVVNQTQIHIYHGQKRRGKGNLKLRGSHKGNWAAYSFEIIDWKQ